VLPNDEGRNTPTNRYRIQILKENDTRTERIWLTKNQFEVLEIVARALDQSISEYITETILSMLECKVDDIVSWKLKTKLERRSSCPPPLF
jgi:DNA-binding Xre family transcriptional regulator